MHHYGLSDTYRIQIILQIILGKFDQVYTGTERASLGVSLCKMSCIRLHTECRVMTIYPGFVAKWVIYFYSDCTNSFTREVCVGACYNASD